MVLQLTKLQEIILMFYFAPLQCLKILSVVVITSWFSLNVIIMMGLQTEQTIVILVPKLCRPIMMPNLGLVLNKNIPYLIWMVMYLDGQKVVSQALKVLIIVPLVPM